MIEQLETDRERILTLWTNDKIQWQEKNRALRERVRLLSARAERLSGQLALLERRLTSLTARHEAALAQLIIEGDAASSNRISAASPQGG